MDELAQHFLNALSYDPINGTFTWKLRDTTNADWRIKTWNSRYAGKQCINLDKQGYAFIRCNGKVIKAHRLVFLIENGFLPAEVDHINGNKSDNRISNLRPATDTQNRWNSGKRYNNKSGWKGVCWNKDRGKWQAQISIDKKRTTIGYFDDVKDAAEEFIFASLKHYGEYTVVA